MGDKRWYTADALLADLTNRHHHFRAASEGEVERRVHKRYPEAVAILVRPEAVAILVRPEDSWRQDLSPSRSGPIS